MPARQQYDFPDVPLDGVTELRIHGVSGTPPSSMLEDPQPVQVWGDKIAGFFRRRADAPPQPGRDPKTKDRNLEAYSWGGLTAGASARAAWLLLLPFMLINVASWAHPPRRGSRSGPVGTMSGAVRVLALTLTLTFVLSAAFLTMDLLAWQCAADVERCGSEHWYTRFLTEGYTARPGARIALGALVPVALVFLIRHLATSTAKRYEEWGEKQPAPPDQPELPRGVWDMGHPNFWRGGGPLSRLRKLHVAASLAFVAGIVAYAAGDVAPDDVAPIGAVLAITAAAFVLLAAALLSSPLTGRRRELIEDRLPNPRYCRAVTLAPFAAGLLLLAALVYAALLPDTDPTATALPGLRGIKHVVVGAQAAAFLLFLGANAAAARRRDPAQPDAAAGLLLNGFAASFVALLGIALAGAFVAGATIRAADYLGCPGDCAAPDDVTFVLPGEYTGTARGFAVATVAMVGAGIWVWFVARKRNLRRAAADVETEYAPDCTDPKRRATIAKVQAMAGLTDHAMPPLAVVVVAGVLGAFAVELLPEGGESLMSTAGSWLVGAFALGLVGLGHSAYRNESLRRTVGILWDLGTFWPRAAHPFAPPCYCERTVPELSRRIDHMLDSGGSVVVSAHSQGTVIAQATLLQLHRHPGRDRIALLTYGSPLHRLYSRAFPHFFGLPVLNWTREAYGGRWVNLYRRSDPIGGPVSRADADVPATAERPDRRLPDPLFKMPDYAFVWPPAYGHSHYFKDPAFATTVETLAGEVRAE